MERRTDPATGKEYPYLEPCLLRERYEHKPTGKEVIVNRRREFARCGIKEVGKIGVFFHRGDGLGEGGGNVYWLSNRWIGMLFEKLIGGGLIVTDGSLCHARQLKKFHRKDIDGKEGAGRVAPFEKRGRLWRCLDWAKPKYGPTLIWQAAQSSA